MDNLRPSRSMSIRDAWVAASMVMAALADFVGSVTDVAVIVTTPPVGTAEGAVKVVAPPLAVEEGLKDPQELEAQVTFQVTPWPR